jgi:hypothetical protein
MATTEVVTLRDDLDTRITSGVETVTFYDPETGDKLEIELGEANRKHLEAHIAKLEKYIAVARVVTAPKPAAKATASKTPSEAGKIREWAKLNGHDVGARGRIKPEIVEAYHAAQNGTVKTPEVAVEPTSEAAASVALDGETQVVEGSQEVANGTDEAWQGDGPSDAELLAMMAELEAEKGEVTFDDLREAVDSKTE